MAIIISLANQKGGSGKSTITLELANSLVGAPFYKRILIIDTDKQGTCVAIRKQDRLKLAYRTCEVAKEITAIFDNLSKEEENELQSLLEGVQEEKREIFSSLLAKIFQTTEINTKDLFLSPTELTKIENASIRIQSDIDKIENNSDDSAKQRKITRLKNLFYVLIECTGNWEPPYKIMNRPPDVLFTLIAEVFNDYDYIFIDMPGRAHEDGIRNLLCACDVIFIPLKSGDSDQLSSVDFMGFSKQAREKRRKSGQETEVFAFFNQVKNTNRWKDFMNTIPLNCADHDVVIPTMEDPFSLSGPQIDFSLSDRTTYEDTNSYTNILETSGIDKKSKDEFKVFVNKFHSLIEN